MSPSNNRLATPNPDILARRLPAVAHGPEHVREVAAQAGLQWPVLQEQADDAARGRDSRTGATTFGACCRTIATAWKAVNRA